MKSYLVIVSITTVIVLNIVLLIDRVKLKEKTIFNDITIQNLKDNQKTLGKSYINYINDCFIHSTIVAELCNKYLTENKNSYSIFISPNNCSTCVDELILLIESIKNEKHRYTLYINENDVSFIKLWKNKINNDIVYINNSGLDVFEAPLIIKIEDKKKSFIFYSPIINEIVEIFFSTK